MNVKIRKCFVSIPISNLVDMKKAAKTYWAECAKHDDKEGEEQ